MLLGGHSAVKLWAICRIEYPFERPLLFRNKNTGGYSRVLLYLIFVQTSIETENLKKIIILSLPCPSGSSIVPPNGSILPSLSRSAPRIGTSISVPDLSIIVVPINIGNSCPVLVSSYIPTILLCIKLNIHKYPSKAHSKSCFAVYLRVCSHQVKVKCLKTRYWYLLCNYSQETKPNLEEKDL